MFDYTTFKPDCVIIGAGDFPKSDIPLSILRNAPYLCCCDGAAASLIDKGVMPQAIVGDGDSLTEEFKHRYKEIIHLITEQEDNDLTKATRFCTARGHHKIAYLGATGRREDHTLGNISLMVNYLVTMGIEPVMFTNHGVFLPCTGHSEFRSFERQQVSVFNLTCGDMASTRLKYPLYAVSEWWQGTLNEALGDSFTIDGDGAYLVYQTYDAKLTEPGDSSLEEKS